MAKSCSSCGCNNLTCGCKNSYLTTPPPCPTPVDCPDAQPCAEVFPAECILYTGENILCEEDIVVAQNSSVSAALESIVNYFCGIGANLYLLNPLQCPEDPLGTIAAAGTPVNQAIEDVVTYFCNALANQPLVEVVAGDNTTVTSNTVGNLTTYTVNGLEAVVVAGDGIDVSVNTIGNTTTYTVATESPVLKKFIYQEILPNSAPGQQITIFNTLYASCGLPTIGCPGSTGTIPNPVDLQIQGYWFNTDLNYWIEFTHSDKTDIYVDASGTIAILPALFPTPSDPEQPVTVRINIIG